MKSTLTFVSLFLLLSSLAFAQVPQAFNYQAIARDANGDCLSDQTIDVRIGIRDSSASGTVVYLERFDDIITNAQGLFSLSIGTGVPQGIAIFNSLDWSIGQRWLEIELDAGNGFMPVGSQQLMSVPYAMYADNKPFFDSGWFPMSSQNGNDSYQEVMHALGEYPSEVKVLTRAVDGNNAGFIFEGVGSAQADDTSDQYGGLVFAYNQQMVRLWAPTLNNDVPVGRIINVTDGWGNEINTQESNEAEVRVLVWR